MTAEHLTAYIQDESYLYTLNYEELKTLVMQYPYATNLRVLLLKKSQIDDLKDYDRNLQMVASYTTNRKFLYAMTKRLKARKVLPQSIVLGEEFLELTALSNLERLIVEKEALPTTTDAKPPQLAADWTLEFDNFEEEKTYNQEQNDREEAVVEAILELRNPTQTIDNQIFSDDEDIDALINNIVLDIEDKTEIATPVADESPVSDLEIVAGPKHAKKVLDSTHAPLSVDNNAEWLSIFDPPISEIPPSVSAAEKPIQPTEFVEERAILANLFKEMDAAEASLSLTNTDFAVVNPKIEEKQDLEWLEIGASKGVNERSEKAEIAIENIQIAAKTDDFEEEITVAIAENSVLGREKEESLKTPNVITETTKPHFDLEILNEDRATIVETATATNSSPNTEGGQMDAATSFTEWLRQFKMATPNTSLRITPIEKPPAPVFEEKPAVAIAVETPQNDVSDEESAIAIAKQEEAVSSLDESKSSVADKSQIFAQNAPVMPRVVVQYKSAVAASVPESKTEYQTQVVDNQYVIEEKSAPKFDLETEFDGVKTDFAAVTKTDVSPSRFVGSFEFLFENQDPLPENVLGLDDDQPSMSRQEASNLVKKALDTEGGQKAEIEVKKSVSDAADAADSAQDSLKKKKKKVLHELAAKSIVSDETVMSETLANILALQGNKDKATEMYRRLALAFPEKSGYFAAKIEALSHFK